MGRGRLTDFDEVSAPGPAVFLEDVGMKGPCFGSDGNAVPVLQVWLRSFVWRIERSEGALSRELVTYRTRSSALCGNEDGQLAGWDAGRSSVRFRTSPRDPTEIRWLPEG